MIETEIKIKLPDPIGANEIEARLGIILEPEIFQEDVIFAASPEIIRELEVGAVISRVRTVGSQTELAVKRIRSLQPLIRDEFELAIDDVENATSMLGVFGQREILTISKWRRCGKWYNTVLTFDRVSELGNFLELELLSDRSENQGEEIAEIASKCIERLGIGEASRINEPYDQLLLQKKASEASS